MKYSLFNSIIQNYLYLLHLQVKDSGYIYSKWANEKFDYTVDGTQCKCEPNFTIIEEIRPFDRKQFLKECAVE